jgi:Family of unknown function (DUF6526)
MATTTQNYKNHRQYVPLYHFVAEPVLLANVLIEATRFYRNQTPYAGWRLLVAMALAIFVVVARSMTLRVQDRVIRLEERQRLTTLLPADTQGRINDLTPSQLVALRFASDEELPGLAHRCLDGELTKRHEIKKEVRTWRPDMMRA